MQAIIGLVAGLIFGIGLVVSGMADPAKVQNFLDIFGAFDPSLAFVMGAAVTVATIGYRLAFARRRPVLDETFHLPASTTIDARLLAGAAMFGIGWGLTGFCPGPAIVSVPLLAPGTLAFVPAMLAGIAIGRTLLAPEPKARAPGPSVPFANSRGTHERRISN